MDEIGRLAEKSNLLEPTTIQRDELMRKVHAYGTQFLEKLSSSPTYSKGHVDFSLQPSTTPQSIESLLGIYNSQVAEKGIRAASGGHLGYIPGGGLYTASLADYLVDITNEYAGVHFASPGAVAIENGLIDWMKSIFRFPDTAVGNLTSGGSIANLIALTTARDKHQIKGAKIEQSVIYLSAHAHHCIHKALRIIGLEEIQISEIDLDEKHRLRVDLLTKAVQQDREHGLNPFLVIASSGTTDTGAVDPLLRIGQLCQTENLWFHVDAAYGGFFILLEKMQSLFEGIELADSLAVDPHKSMFLPFGIGAVLVKDREAIMHSHHYMANYMQDTIGNDHPISPADLSPELSKHFRGLRMWLPLQLHGIEPFKACLEEKTLLIQYMRHRLLELGFEVGPEPDLSVSYFWCPKEDDQNHYNEKFMQLIQEDGEIFFSSTMIDEQFVIRIAILSFRTKLETIDRAIEMIIRTKESLDNPPE